MLKPRKEFGLIAWLILALPFVNAIHASGKKDFLTYQSGFKEVWQQEFLFKPVVSLGDQRAHVDTWLLAGSRHWTSMLCVLMTDLFYTSLGKNAIYSTVPLFCLQAHAEKLKGSSLTQEETQRIRDLHKKQAKSFYWQHTDKNYITRAHYAIVLKGTVGNTQSVEKALRRLARENGCLCSHAISEEPTAEQILQLLNEGNPVLLEKKGHWNINPRRMDDGKWRLVFGAYEDGEGNLQFLVNIPEETMLMERWAWTGEYPEILESEHLYTINEFNHYRQKDTMYADIRSIIDNFIGNYGFMTCPASWTKDYRLHAIRHRRRGGSAWDAELREILCLPKAMPKHDSPKPDASPLADELWRYYFVENAGSAGITYDGGALMTWRLAEGSFPPLESVVLSAVACTRPNFLAFGLSRGGRLFHCARLFLENSFLSPTQKELDQCIALHKAELGKYMSKYGELPWEPYERDDIRYSDYIMKRDQPGFQSPYRLEEHLFHSLPRILNGIASVRDATDRMAPGCGWSALVEGGPGTNWDTVKLAIWRQIPVLLEGKGGDWRLAVAYLVHNDKTLLLATKRQETLKSGVEPVLNTFTLPETLPPNMEFIEYDEKQWTPWFVHHFEPTVEHLAPQILEIFKAHPEAQAMLKKDADKTATPGQ